MRSKTIGYILRHENIINYILPERIFAKILCPLINIVAEKIEESTMKIRLIKTFLYSILVLLNNSVNTDPMRSDDRIYLKAPDPVIDTQISELYVNGDVYIRLKGAHLQSRSSIYNLKIGYKYL